MHCWKTTQNRATFFEKSECWRALIVTVRAQSISWRLCEQKIEECTFLRFWSKKLEICSNSKWAMKSLIFELEKVVLFLKLNFSSMLFRASYGSKCWLKVNRCGFFWKVEKKRFKMSHFWENLWNWFFRFILSSILNSWVRLNFSFVGSGPSGQALFLDN